MVESPPLAEFSSFSFSPKKDGARTIARAQNGREVQFFLLSGTYKAIGPPTGPQSGLKTTAFSIDIPVVREAPRSDYYRLFPLKRLSKDDNAEKCFFLAFGKDHKRDPMASYFCGPYRLEDREEIQEMLEFFTGGAKPASKMRRDDMREALNSDNRWLALVACAILGLHEELTAYDLLENRSLLSARDMGMLDEVLSVAWLVPKIGESLPNALFRLFRDRDEGLLLEVTRHLTSTVKEQKARLIASALTEQPALCRRILDGVSKRRNQSAKLVEVVERLRREVLSAKSHLESH